MHVPLERMVCVVFFREQAVSLAERVCVRLRVDKHRPAARPQQRCRMNSSHEQAIE